MFVTHPRPQLGSAQKEKARPVAVPDFLKVLSYISPISQPERINCDMLREISEPCYEQLNLRWSGFFLLTAFQLAPVSSKLHRPTLNLVCSFRMDTPVLRL